MEAQERRFHCTVCMLCESVALSEDIESLARALTQAALKGLSAKGALVKLLDEKHERLKLASAEGLSKDYLAAGSTEVKKDPVEARAIAGEMVEVPDASKQENWPEGKKAASEGIGPVLVAPLCLKDRCIGTLHIYYEKGAKFGEDEKAIAHTLAVHAGIVLERLRAQGEAKALEEISQAVNSTLDENLVLEIIARHAAEVLGFKAASIRMLDEEGKYLEERAAFGLSERYIHKGPVEPEKSPMDREVLEGKVIAVSDAELDTRLQYPEEVHREGIRAMLCLPLMIKGRAMGVLRVYSSVPYAFVPSEVEFLKSLANHGAIAIENARLFEHLRRDYTDLSRAVWKWYDWGERPPRM